MIPCDRALVLSLIVAILSLTVGACGRDRKPAAPGVTPVPTWTPTVRAITNTASAYTPTSAAPVAAPVATDMPPAQPSVGNKTTLPAPLYFIDSTSGQIVRMEQDGATVTVITHEQEPVLDLDLSPVDGQLAYVSGNNLLQSDALGGNRRVIVDGPDVPLVDRQNETIRYGPTLTLLAPRFSPDGQQLAFGLGGVKRMPVSGTTEPVTLLASDPYTPTSNTPNNGNYYLPYAWSPDGSRLLVEARNYWEGRWWGVLEQPSRDNHYSQVQACCDPVWSPAGDAVYLGNAQPAVIPPGLHRWEMATGTLHTLLEQVGAAFPYVNADGTLLAFMATGKQAPESGLELLALHRLDPTINPPQSVRLRSDAYNIWAVLWAADGSGALITERNDISGHALLTGALTWLPVDGNLALPLPAQGSHPHWGLPAAARTVPTQAATVPPLAQEQVISAAIGVLALPDQLPTRLAIDQQYVYWVAHPDERSLYRYPLQAGSAQPGTVETVATTRYPQGVLDQFPLVQMGEWLVFFDSAYPTISDRWTLRAFHVATQTERTIAASASGSVLHGFAAGNQRIAWTAIEHAEGRACADEAMLIVYDFASGVSTELDRACTQTEHLWGGVGLAQDHLVGELLYPDAQARGAIDIVLFDLSAADPTAFLSLNTVVTLPRLGCCPIVTGDWVLWQQGANDFGDPVLVNLRTKTISALPTANAGGECQYLQAAAGWIFGVDCANWQRLLLYQPDRRQVVSIPTSAMGRIGAAAVFGNMVAIAGAVEPGIAQWDSTIAWYSLASVASTTLEPTPALPITANDWGWVAPSLGQQSSPQISGDVVVWVQEEAGAAAGTTSRVWTQALSGGAGFAVAPAYGPQERPAIDGDFIVWQDGRNSCPSCDRDIYGYQLSTRQEFTVAVGPNDQIYPAIDGSLVVWQEVTNAQRLIRGRDLVSGKEFALTVPAEAFRSYGPLALAGKTIVYCEYVPHARDARIPVYTLHAHDLQTGVHTVVTQSMGWPIPEYAISGKRIAWSGWSVAVFDLTTGLTRSLPAHPLAYIINIEGDLVVWAEGELADRIVGYDLAHNTSLLIAEPADSRSVSFQLAGATLVGMIEHAAVWNIAVRTLKLAR